MATLRRQKVAPGFNQVTPQPPPPTLSLYVEWSSNISSENVFRALHGGLVIL